MYVWVNIFHMVWSLGNYEKDDYLLTQYGVDDNDDDDDDVVKSVY